MRRLPGSRTLTTPWRGEKDAGKYADMAGFCKSASLEEIRKHGHVLTPGRYVDVESGNQDGEPFEEKLKRLTTIVRQHQAEAVKLDAAIATSLEDLGYGAGLNPRMNTTLETVVQRIYKSWFEDFEPVRAKMEGRWRPGEFLPGLPVSLYNLFPHKLVKSELGDIPEGWEVITIGNVAEVIDCLHSKKPERYEVGRPFLQLANIRDDGLIDMHDTYLINEVDYRKWVSRIEASPGDCVITNVGRVGAAAQVPVGLKAALGRNMTGIRLKPKFPFPTMLIECLLSQTMRREIELKIDTGTILDSLNVRNIPHLRFVCPTREILEYFERKVRPLRAQMERNLAEVHTLAGLRDTLLPKLLSGGICVK